MSVAKPRDWIDTLPSGRSRTTCSWVSKRVSEIDTALPPLKRLPRTASLMAAMA